MRHAFLTDKKIYLRALEREDLSIMFGWAHDPDVTRYMYMGTFPNSIEGLEHEFKRLVKAANLLQLPAHPSDIVFAIVEKETDHYIGNVGLFNINWITQIADLRVLIGEKECWGRGYAQEAYRLTIRYAFDRLNLRRLVAGTRADHAISAAVLEKVGFTQEGCQREHFLRDGQVYDILNFGLLRREFHGDTS